MEQVLYFIVFIIYVVYSIYQSVQKESQDKKVVEDWEGQAAPDERSIEEILSEYLEPKREVPIEEATAAATASQELDEAEERRSLAQELREMPHANNYRERERRKINIDGDDTIGNEKTELSPTEELRQRLAKEKAEEKEVGELSAAEEYKLLAAERMKERNVFRSTANLDREKVNIKDQQQLDKINEVYGQQKNRKNRPFNFNGRDAIIYQIIMKKKF